MCNKCNQSIYTTGKECLCQEITNYKVDLTRHYESYIVKLQGVFSFPSLSTLNDMQHKAHKRGVDLFKYWSLPWYKRIFYQSP